MKTQNKILTAFILNLVFSVFEFIGGIFTGSVAIISDSVHDMGDAASIGISYFLERKSKKQPDETYTYGYMRYSVIGSVITTSILIFGSAAVIYNSVLRILNPAPINYNGMLIFAFIGTAMNVIAALSTKDGESLNSKAVNLHMLEDALGWIAVLIGAVIMKITDITLIDPVISIMISLFILYNAVKNMKQVIDIFLEKIPGGISVSEIKEHLLELEGVKDVHHIHIRSIDGYSNYATMHIVTDEKAAEIKPAIRHLLLHHGINHVTLELEGTDELCSELDCKTEKADCDIHHHHHHH